MYRGNVDAGNGVALLIGRCTRVEGEIRARKIKRLGGCPIGAKQLLIAIPMSFGLPSPMLDLVDSLKFIVFSIDKALRRLVTSLFGPKLAE